MKVLLITDNHTPGGGAENYFFELKNRLKKMPGIEVHSLGFGTAESSGKDFFVLKALKSNMAKLFWRMLPHPIVYFKLRRHIRKIQPDVIHIHNIKQYSNTLLRVIKPYHVVQTMHDFSAICPTGQNIHKNLHPCTTGLRVKCLLQHQVKFNLLTYFVLLPSFYGIRSRLKKTVAAFAAPSPLLAGYLQRNHFQNVSCIPPFLPEKSSYSFDHIKPGHFLFAGNLGSHKGVDVLLDEFALACRKNTNLVLNIAGKGPEEARMVQKVHALKLQKNVIFHGWQTDMDPLYAQNIAVIFPSTGLEAFGLVMTDAMSHARPIIGADRGTVAWLVDDKQTGLLFDPQQKGDLAEKVLALAADNEMAKKLGSNGFRKLQTIVNNDAAMTKILALYRTP